MAAHRRRSAAAAALAGALVVALGMSGCGDGSIPTATIDPDDLDLTGRTFLSTEVQGYTLAPDTRVVLTFDRERVGASAGCNALDGDFEVDDSVLVVDKVTQTEIGCSPELADQDRWLAELLTSRPTLSRAGPTITLTTAAVTVRLTDQEVADPDRPLEGTVWTVVSTIVGDGASQAPPGGSIVFDGGTVEVELGCNTGTGAYTLEGSTITFGELTATAKTCDDAGVMALETAMTDVLRGDVTFHITASRLDLTGPAGGLQLRAS